MSFESIINCIANFVTIFGILIEYRLHRQRQKNQINQTLFNSFIDSSKTINFLNLPKYYVSPGEFSKEFSTYVTNWVNKLEPGSLIKISEIAKEEDDELMEDHDVLKSYAEDIEKNEHYEPSESGVKFLKRMYQEREDKGRKNYQIYLNKNESEKGKNI